MHRKSIVHVVTKTRMKSEAFSAEVDAMEDLSERYGIKNIIFYKGDEIEYKDLIKKLKKIGILLRHYANKDDLKSQSLEINKEYEILFVYTPLELLINTVNELKDALGHPVSYNPAIFRDKSLQRKLIQDHAPDLGIKFLNGSPEDLNINEIEEKIGYPFIIKPIDGVQSSGVAKISNRQEFDDYIADYHCLHDALESNGINNTILLVEEYVKGKLYSVDYFVNKDHEVLLSRPLKVKTGADFEVDDYCIIGRMSTEKTESDFKGKSLKNFIHSTIKATGMRNTFVHHEFKINQKGLLKTIELNGRLGGGRLEVIKAAYGINLYDFILNVKPKNTKLKTNNIAINIYATKQGTLQGFCEKIFDRISKRETVYDVCKDEAAIGKTVGLTKHGFRKVGIIKLQSKNYAKIRKDYLYIKLKYKDLLDIDTSLIKI